MTADDLLAGRAFPGKKIVIVGGGSVGCETADSVSYTHLDVYKRQEYRMSRSSISVDLLLVR